MDNLAAGVAVGMLTMLLLMLNTGVIPHAEKLKSECEKNIITECSMYFKE